MVGQVSAIPWSYAGLLDDALPRTLASSKSDADRVNRMLIRNVLFGGPLLVNDGYLLHDESAFRQFLDDDSLLRICVRNGFVKILLRGLDENRQTPKDHANYLTQFGIAESALVSGSPYYQENKDRFASILGNALVSGAAEPWPNYQTSSGFMTLFRRVFVMDDDEIRMLGVKRSALDELHARLSNQEQMELGAGRSVVEHEILNLRRQKIVSAREAESLLRFAIRAYHYNFSMCLSVDRGEKILTETIGGFGFGDLLNLRVDNVEPNALESLPSIAIPKGLPLNDSRLFEKLIDPTTELHTAKRRFIETTARLQSSSSNLPIELRISEAKDAIEDYVSELSSVFSKYVGVSEVAPKTDWIIKYAVEKLTKGVLGIAVTVLGSENRLSRYVKSAQRAVDQRVLEVNMRAGANTFKKRLEFDVGDSKPWYSNLELDANATAQHVASVPKFSD